MSCIIPGSLASANDLKTLGINKNAKYLTGSKAGQTVPDYVQQRKYVADLIAQNKRSVNKTITAIFTATGAATAVIGNALGLSSDADANGAWQFQNAGASGGTAAFNATVNAYPFRYIGVQIDVSASTMFTACTFTELINDYDNNTTRSLFPDVNSGLNTYAQVTTTRFMSIAGEFNGFYGIKVTGITNAQTIRFSFNVVDINRGW